MRVIIGFALAFAVLALIALATGCSPRAMATLNKQAPDPPYMGEFHGGMDRAQYLRDTEPLE